jgi:rare lipoprotein A
MKEFIASLLVATCCAASEKNVVGTEEGVASFYADSLHGNTTASGERYDKRALTAAHRSLAFGTEVRIIRKDTGKSIVVVVNDRGPHSDELLIDLSGAAADKLDMKTLGRVDVKLEILGE